MYSWKNIKTLSKETSTLKKPKKKTQWIAKKMQANQNDVIK